MSPWAFAVASAVGHVLCVCKSTQWNSNTHLLWLSAVNNTTLSTCTSVLSNLLLTVDIKFKALRIQHSKFIVKGIYLLTCNKKEKVWYFKARLDLKWHTTWVSGSGLSGLQIWPVVVTFHGAVTVAEILSPALQVAPPSLLLLYQ